MGETVQKGGEKRLFSRFRGVKYKGLVVLEERNFATFLYLLSLWAIDMKLGCAFGIKNRSGELGGLNDALADKLRLGTLYAFKDVVDLLWCVEAIGLDDVLSWSS